MTCLPDSRSFPIPILVVFRSLVALFASLAVLLTGHGLQLTLAPLYADDLGWQTTQIGYLGSSYFLGFVIGCLVIPRLVASVGHIRVFTVLTAIATGALLALGLNETVAVWLVARMLTGFSIAGLYMVIESWLNERSSTENRGTILSVYTVTTLLAICAGQLLVSINLGFPQMIMGAAMLLALSAIPIGLTRISHPDPLPRVGFKLREVYESSHVAVVGALAGGFVTAGFWAMGPVVANALGFDQIGLFMAVTILGGAVIQLPVGRLSDSYDRRHVIAGLAIMGVLVSSTAILSGGDNLLVILICMFLFGGATFPLYSICLAHANDGSELPLIEIGSVILIMNSIGSVIGPVFVARVLAFSPLGLFYLAAATLLTLACWIAWRIRKYPITRDHFEPYVDVPRTTMEIIGVSQDDDPASANGDAVQH